MNNRLRFLTLSAFMTLAGFSAAYAQPAATGEYRLSVGHASPCSITLAADGTTTAGACVVGVARWQTSGSDIELAKGSGEIFAVLHPRGDGFAGETFADNHTIVLTPASQTAGLTH